MFYVQTDYYLGRFLHYLDEGWTVLIFSDHGLISSAHDMVELGDDMGVNCGIMEELGLMTLKRDENGNRMKEIDWEHTVAVAQREQHIYINLKGRDPHGIVDPKDKYEVEEEVMTRLYGYRDKKTGKRVVAVALRNQGCCFSLVRVVLKQAISATGSPKVTISTTLTACPPPMVTKKPAYRQSSSQPAKV